MRAKLALAALCPWLALAANFSVFPDEDSITYSNGWAPVTLDSGNVAGSNTFAGNSLIQTSQNGATATLAFSGDAVWFVTTSSPQSGTALLRIDGVNTLFSSFNSPLTTRNFQALVANNLSDGPHTLQVVAVLTDKQPTLDIEGYIFHRSDGAVTVGPTTGKTTAGSSQANVAPPAADNGASPALVPALAATGCVALFVFVGLGVWYYVRRRRRQQKPEASIVDSTLVSAWAKAVPVNDEKTVYDRHLTLLTSDLDADGRTTREGPWSSFYRS